MAACRAGYQSASVLTGILLVLCSTLALGVTTYGPIEIAAPNDGVTGTFLHGTATIKPGTGFAVGALTTQTNVPVGIVTQNAGTSGIASLATGGVAPCTMDATISANAGGFYVVQSVLQNYQCHPQAAAPAPGVWVIGFIYGEASTTTNALADVWVNGFFYGGGSSSGVTSFGAPGRTGAVVPQQADYQALLLTNGALLTAPFSVTDQDANFIAGGSNAIHLGYTGSFFGLSPSNFFDISLAGNLWRFSSSGLTAAPTGATTGSGALVEATNPVLPSWFDLGGISVPGNPGTGNARFFFNTGTSLLQCLTNAGANCMPTPTWATIAGGTSANTFVMGVGGVMTYIAGGVVNANQIGGLNIPNLTTPGNLCTTGSVLAICPAGTGTVTSVGLLGTANQITVTGATPITGSGSWTLSLPTNVSLTNLTVGGTLTFLGNALPGSLSVGNLCWNGTIWTFCVSTGSGTVTAFTFSPGTLGTGSSAFATYSVTNSTTTPNVTAALANAGAFTLWGNNSNATAQPGYQFTVGAAAGNIPQLDGGGHLLSGVIPWTLANGNPLYGTTAGTALSSPSVIFMSTPSYQDGGGDNCKTLNNIWTTMPSGSWVVWDIAGPLECNSNPWNGVTFSATIPGTLDVGHVAATAWTSASWVQPPKVTVVGPPGGGESNTNEDGTQAFSVTACPAVQTHCLAALPKDTPVYALISNLPNANYSGAGSTTRVSNITIDCSYVQGARALMDYYTQENGGAENITYRNCENNGVELDIGNSSVNGDSDNSRFSGINAGATTAPPGATAACTYGAVAVRMNYPAAGTPGPKSIRDITANHFQCQQLSVTISAFSGTSGTLTFTTSAQTALTAGQWVTLTGFTGGNTGLNNQYVQVLAAGLSSTAFEAAVTGSGYSSGAGSASFQVNPNYAVEINGCCQDWSGKLHTEETMIDAIRFGTLTLLGTASAVGTSVMTYVSGDAWPSGCSGDQYVYYENTRYPIASCTSSTLTVTGTLPTNATGRYSIETHPGAANDVVHTADHCCSAHFTGSATGSVFTVTGGQAPQPNWTNGTPILFCTSSSACNGYIISSITGNAITATTTITGSPTIGTYGALVGIDGGSPSASLAIENFKALSPYKPATMVADDFNVLIPTTTDSGMVKYAIDKSDKVLADDSGLNPVNFIGGILVQNGWPGTGDVFVGVVTLPNGTLIGPYSKLAITPVSTPGINPGAPNYDHVSCGFNADPSGVAGYGPSSNGLLTFVPYLTGSAINGWIYNNNPVGNTPGPMTVNCSIYR